MAKRFTTPFATTGDKTAIPDTVQPDGSVSYAQGFGYDYERDYSDPLSKDIARESMNQALNDITSAVGEIQQNGVAPFDAANQPYPKGAIVGSGGDLYVSTIAGNNNNIPHASWQKIVLENGLVQATESAAGVAEIATQAETNAGTDDMRFITPRKLKGYEQPSITESATTTASSNQIVCTGIVAALGLEVGDVLQIQYSGYNKLHTVEAVINANTIAVNYEHCSARGNGPLKLENKTSISMKFIRIAKWYNAPIGLGMLPVDVTALRLPGVTYTSPYDMKRSLMCKANIHVASDVIFEIDWNEFAVANSAALVFLAFNFVHAYKLNRTHATPYKVVEVR